MRLHLDSSAAQGILDRQGLSKVRHIDVNVLWLQEQSAKEVVPLEKIKGTVNPADLMTKNLTAIMMNDHCSSLNLQFAEGRAQAAAKLHSIARRARQQEAAEKLCALSSERWDHGGGDAWKSRGTGGVWSRVHREPRRELFTPYKIPRGPSTRTEMLSSRTTTGVTRSGQTFSITDNFKDSRVAHLALHEEWTGVTTFRTAPASRSSGRCKSMSFELQ